MDFTTIDVFLAKRKVQVTMPSVTTLGYAAKRVAEHLGWDPDALTFTLGCKAVRAGSKVEGIYSKSDTALISETEGPFVLAAYCPECFKRHWISEAQ